MTMTLDHTVDLGSHDPAGTRTRRPRLGERQAQAWIDYGRPDIAGSRFRHYKRRRVAVIGPEHAVRPVLRDLDELARQKPGTTVTLITPERRDAATPAAGRVVGFRVHGFYPTEGGVMLEGDDGRWIGPFDRLIVGDLHDAP
ncbi:MAG: hypothetical protein HZB15_01715 [Actinobacteria bacterium]|nr:hypothetical protein [Actinomycetota bacterium]